MKINQYQLVGAGSETALDEAVNALIATGWQPFGSPSIVAPVDKEPRFFQAMVLRDASADA